MDVNERDSAEVYEVNSPATRAILKGIVADKEKKGWGARCSENVELYCASTSLCRKPRRSPYRSSLAVLGGCVTLPMF